MAVFRPEWAVGSLEQRKKMGLEWRGKILGQSWEGMNVYMK